MAMFFSSCVALFIPWTTMSERHMIFDEVLTKKEKSTFGVLRLAFQPLLHYLAWTLLF